MDPNNLSSADGIEEALHQNGVHEEPSNSVENGVASNDVDPSVTENTEALTPNGDFENSNQPDTTTTGNSSAEENKGSNDDMDGNNVTVSKEEEVKINDQTEKPKARKGPVKNNNAKAPSSKVVQASLVKGGKEEEASSAVSNGTSAQPRQPTKTRSFNDRQNQLSKHTSKSEAASSEVPMDKTKPKSSKKGSLDKAQGEPESSSSTNAEDAKPRRVGTLPNYGFSFKCNERAERRKEFYTKLEEKIQAKEVEKSNLQAKSKESQEAEIKMLRKSLTFKATPMPSFYQEPLPPKVELKKIPTTRAKSPKLGRKKDSTNSESDGNTSSRSQQGRLSLDEKVSQGNTTKGIVPAHQKKPQRRSLPTRLVSDRISSSNSATAPASSKAVNSEKNLPTVTRKESSSSNATGEEKVETAAATEENSTLYIEKSEALAQNDIPSDKPSEAEPQVNGDIAVEENPQPALVQEPIAAEH